jgi:hypothetical protein
VIGICERCHEPLDDDEDRETGLCSECSYLDDDGDPVEPEEGDYVTEDDESCRRMRFHEYGTRRHLLTVYPDETDWVRAVKDHMEREQFWPNVWFLSDHGNWHLWRLSCDESEVASGADNDG